MTIVARLQEKALCPDRELAALLEQATGDGAVVNFVPMKSGRSSVGLVTSLPSPAIQSVRLRACW